MSVAATEKGQLRLRVNYAGDMPVPAWNIRIYGNPDANGHIIFDKIMGH